jgi:hypothetical protein
MSEYPNQRCNVIRSAQEVLDYLRSMVDDPDKRYHGCIVMGPHDAATLLVEFDRIKEELAVMRMKVDMDKDVMEDLRRNQKWQLGMPIQDR